MPWCALFYIVFLMVVVHCLVCLELFRSSLAMHPSSFGGIMPQPILVWVRADPSDSQGNGHVTQVRAIRVLPGHFCNRSSEEEVPFLSGSEAVRGQGLQRWVPASERQAVERIKVIGREKTHTHTHTHAQQEGENKRGREVDSEGIWSLVSPSALLQWFRNHC